MTIIVADRLNGVMAADRLLCLDNDSVTHCVKIVRGPDGALAGAAGDCDQCSIFLTWVKSGRADALPKFKPAGFQAVLLTMEHELFLWAEALVPDKIEAEFFAVGAGALAALGARYLGANVWQAVDAACAICSSCGGGIDILNLDGTGHYTPL